MFGLTRRHPWSELRSLEREFDNFFKDAFDSFGIQRMSSNMSNNLMPSADLSRNDDGWVATIALPGIAPDQMQIDVTGRTVHVRAERRVEKDAKSGAGQPYVSELAYGTFERTFTLPDELDADKVVANYRHGLVELTLPIKESARPRRISIGAGSETNEKKDAKELATSAA